MFCYVIGLPISCSKNKTEAQRGSDLAAVALKCWNKLPLHVRLVSSLFKSLLKTQLFCVAFNTVWNVPLLSFCCLTVVCTRVLKHFAHYFFKMFVFLLVF